MSQSPRLPASGHPKTEDQNATMHTQPLSNLHPPSRSPTVFYYYRFTSGMVPPECTNRCNLPHLLTFASCLVGAMGSQDYPVRDTCGIVVSMSGGYRNTFAYF